MGIGSDGEHFSIGVFSGIGDSLFWEEERLMSILLLLVILAVIGVVTWALVTYLPMPAGVKTVIVIVAVVACVIYALHAMGIGLPNPAVPQVR